MWSKKKSIAEDVVDELRPVSRLGGDFRQAAWDRAMNTLIDDLRTKKIYRFAAQTDGVDWVFEFVDGSVATLSEKGIVCEGEARGFDVTWENLSGIEGH